MSYPPVKTSGPAHSSNPKTVFPTKVMVEPAFERSYIDPVGTFMALIVSAVQLERALGKSIKSVTVHEACNERAVTSCVGSKKQQ